MYITKRLINTRKLFFRIRKATILSNTNIDAVRTRSRHFPNRKDLRVYICLNEIREIRLKKSAPKMQPQIHKWPSRRQKL